MVFVELNTDPPKDFGNLKVVVLGSYCTINNFCAHVRKGDVKKINRQFMDKSIMLRVIPRETLTSLYHYSTNR